MKIEVHQIGIEDPFGAPRLGSHELGVQRVGESPNDFVLHVEEVGDGLVEPFGPEMTASLRVDELHIDAHAGAAALNAVAADHE